jgi:hypothetical protein
METNEMDMQFIEPPNYGATHSVLIAAAPLQQGRTEKIAGSCILNPKNIEGGFLPDFVAQQYYSQYEHKDIGSIPASNIRVLKAPQHGTLVFSTNSEISGDPHYLYRPARGFVGNDTVEFSVNVGNETLRVIQTVVVVDGVLSGARETKFCPQGGVWKISTLTPILKFYD